MDTYSVRDLREHTGSLIHHAEEGKLSLVTKRGKPIFLAVPITDELLTEGFKSSMAVGLYEAGTTTLGQAAKIAGEPLEKFMQRLGKLGISCLEYPVEELDEELKHFAA